MNRGLQQKRNNVGFSMVELIIVIAIMAILAGALAPALIKYIEKSRRTTDLRSADGLQSALQRVLARTEFPVTEETIIIIDESTNYHEPATCITDELCIELDGNIPDIKSFPDYYWYLVYNSETGSVPEVHITDSASGEPIYELYPDKTDFAEMNDTEEK